MYDFETNFDGKWDDDRDDDYYNTYIGDVLLKGN